MQDKVLEFVELDRMDTPLEWWEHVKYIVAIGVATAAIAT